MEYGSITPVTIMVRREWAHLFCISMEAMVGISATVNRGRGRRPICLSKRNFQCIPAASSVSPVESSSPWRAWEPPCF